MAKERGKGRGKKVRVDFRRNRSTRARKKDYTSDALSAENLELDEVKDEQVRARGDLSRRRTIIVNDDQAGTDDLRGGVVVAMRGLYADVDEGARIVPCTVRRILRTRQIDERHPVTVGDRVRFRPGNPAEGVVQEGVIEAVEPRKGVLRRRSGKRVHTIVANVDQAIIVSSADQPGPKPHLIDRYIVATLAGHITPLVCMNKMDLDQDDRGREVLERYRELGMPTLAVSAESGEGIDALREALKDKETVFAGQSGVGKSSLLNAAQPGLGLRVGDINEQLNKGRHTTTTARLIRLDLGGYVVDTPGVRSFDTSVVERHEFEAHFVEFLPHIPHCRFPDCTHTHESGCAVKVAVDGGRIHPSRYESYVRLFEGEDA